MDCKAVALLSEMLLDANDQVIRAIDLTARELRDLNEAIKKAITVSANLTLTLREDQGISDELNLDDLLSRATDPDVRDVDPDVPPYLGDRYPLDEADLGGTPSGDQ